MEYSKYLKSRHDLCKKLVNRLLKRFEYVSILGTHIGGKSIAVTTRNVSVGESREKECGFVCKVYNGKYYSEFSFSDITSETISSLEKEIIEKSNLSEKLMQRHVSAYALMDEALVKDFDRPLEGKEHSIEEILEKLKSFKDRAHAYSEKIVQVSCSFASREVSKMFISKNRDLTQHYSFINVMAMFVARNETNMQNSYTFAGYNSEEKAFEEIDKKLEKGAELAIKLLDAEMIVPGEYDIITDPSITGLIAHEAFGHGVEMDMFVKNRALAKDYIGKYVASPLVNMHDGAASCLSSASYFFDDEGALAQDTVIIDKGTLVGGICDSVSASILDYHPTGNGRRQSYKRKAYTRMTNTFFESGDSTLEDMIKSVDYGYYISQTNNGMEDPKNWGIQCTALYGKEIVNGQFTGKIISPVVMSGYVIDLLESISAVSKDFHVSGSGSCGKGYKEWVRVSDGGGCIKAQVKIG